MISTFSKIFPPDAIGYTPRPKKDMITECVE